MIKIPDDYLDYILGTVQDKNYVYIIKFTRLPHHWYFYELESELKPHRVIWGPHITPAFKFPSEQTVEEFRAEFISPRRTEILRMEK